MDVQHPTIPAERIVVMMPNWLGDAVMATPFLHALRSLYPKAHIAAMGRPLVTSVAAGLPFINDIHVLDKSNPLATLGYLRSNRFDLGILLPNSFRSAWSLWRGKVKRRLGYAREFRSPLLTHRLEPMRITPTQRAMDRAKAIAIHDFASENRKTIRVTASLSHKFQPIPTIDYYLALAKYLGAQAPSKTMHLGVTDAEREEAGRVLADLGITTSSIENRKSKIENLVIIVPGANFGSSKCWLPDRFAQVATALADPAGPFKATVLIASSPAEIPIVDAILKEAIERASFGIQNSICALAKLNNDKGISLGALKEIVHRSRLMVCNDTGPRHFSAAFNIPTVTLFGPTDPVWAETNSQSERIIRVNVPCGPCQLKKCPIDHRCMKGITVEDVMAAISDLWHNHSQFDRST